MTKKILALALAGTTAFSVFAGALSVNATAPTPKVGDYKVNGLTFSTGVSIAITGDQPASRNVTVNFNGTTKVTPAASIAAPTEPTQPTASDTGSATKTYLTEYANEYAALSAFSWDDTSATVTSDLIYLYDYVAEMDDLDAFKAKVEAFLEAFDAADALFKADGTLNAATLGDSGVTTVTAVDTAYDAMISAIPNLTAQNTTAKNGTIRYSVLADYYTFKSNMQSSADFDFTGEAAKKTAYDALYTAVTKTYKDSYDTNLLTSELVYAMQYGKDLLEEIDTASTETLEDRIARYVSVLDLRTREDYKNAYDYNGFLQMYEKETTTYASATTVTKLSTYAGNLKNLVLGTTDSGAAATSDKTELKAVIADAEEYVKSGDYTTTNDAWDTFKAILGEAQLVRDAKAADSFQSTIDAYATLLAEAMDAVSPTAGVGDWLWLRLETLTDSANAKVETDYKASYWKALKTAQERAEKLMDSTTASRTVIETVCDNLETAISNLSKGIIKPSSAQRKELKDTIADAKAALQNSEGNGAQVLALTNAINDADNLWEVKYSALKSTTLISKVQESIDALESAMTTAAMPLEWYTDEEGNDRYGTADGDYNDGWHKIDGLWFFFNEKGVALKSQWVEADGKWSWVGSNCVCYRASWIPFEGNYYYVDQNGYMLDSEWLGWNGNWYWLDKGGRMATGWRTIGDKQYYFGSDGAMLSNTTTPDGYKVGIDGAYIEA